MAVAKSTKGKNRDILSCSRQGKFKFFGSSPKELVILLGFKGSRDRGFIHPIFNEFEINFECMPVSLKKLDIGYPI